MDMPRENELIKLGQNSRLTNAGNIQHEPDSAVDRPASSLLKSNTMTIALLLSIFCQALDETIIGTAIPRISNEFHSLGDDGWYGSAYLLPACALQLFWGRTFSIFQSKWCMIAGLFLFELGSLICALAPSSIGFILGRVVAGSGSGGIAAGAEILVCEYTPLSRRSAYVGIIGTAAGIAAAVGPLLGGVITQHANWRWCFWINLPIGTLAIIIIAALFPRTGNDSRRFWKKSLKSYDLVGTGMFVAGTTSLLLALQWAGIKYSWNSPRIVALLSLSGILILSFMIYEFLSPPAIATLPKGVIEQRSMQAGACYSFCTGGSFVLLCYYLPVWFQTVKQASPQSAGLMLLPMIISLVVSRILVGFAVNKVGHYMPFVICSSVLMSIGTGLLTSLATASVPREWIGYQILIGVGLGIGMQQPYIATQRVLPRKDIPAGITAMVFMQALGAAIFVSVGQSVMVNLLVTRISHYGDPISPRIILDAGLTTLGSHLSLSKEQLGEAYNEAVTSAYYIPLALSLCSFAGSAMEWRSVKD